MHSPSKKKKKKKTSLAIHTKLSICSVSTPYALSADKRGSEKSGSNSLFTQCRGFTPRFHSEYNKHALLHIQTDFTVVGL
ncbi:unnamed protein product, partial [Staurois parvus]